ncbi:MAG: DNA internalization-related competence protein ComEC/Rec2 [Candidatus Ancaeobacter aquaticus]|nr:DNA internalization-related competence protein ComEC/Rec2 [Candidatus Ancaeobacter aquaticus]
MRRPFVLITLFFIVGILTASFFPLVTLIPLYILVFCSVILFCSKMKYLSLGAFYALIILCGMIALTAKNQYLTYQDTPFLPDGKKVTAVVTGTVQEGITIQKKILYSDNKHAMQKCIVTIPHVNISGKKYAVSSNILVKIYGENEKVSIAKNDIIEVKGKLKRIDSGSIASLSYKKYIVSHRIGYVMQVSGKKNIRIIGKKIPSIFEQIISRTRARIVKSLTAGIPAGDIKGLFTGMILGDKEGISNSLREAFVRTNTIHVLAISGLHIGLIVLIILGILRFFSMPKAYSALIAIPLIVLYALIVGNKPSVWRATTMAVIVLFGWVIKRESDIVNSLAAAALLLLIWNPYNLYSIGFQLSFVVVLSIIGLTPVIQHYLNKVCGCDIKEKPKRTDTLLRNALTVFSVSVSAWIGSAPLIMYYFGVFSPISVIANIFVTSIVSLAIVPLCFVSIIVGQFSLFVASMFNTVTIYIAQFLITGNTFLAGFSWASFPVYDFTIPDILLWYGVLGMFTHWHPRKVFEFTEMRRWCLYSIIIVFCIFMFSGVLFRSNAFEVTFFDVGQGDAMAIKTSRGKLMLIDAGPNYPYAPLPRKLSSYMRKNTIKEIDAIVITHPHRDHIGGTLRVLEKYKTGMIIGNGSDYECSEYDKIKAYAAYNNIPYHVVKAGDNIHFDDDIEIKVLSPPDETDGWDENERSLVLLVTYQGIRFLFCGDSDVEAIEHLCKTSENLKADIIKVPHHGSDNVNNEVFYEKVLPKIAVITVGKNNSYGLPSKTLLELFLSRNIRAYRTDKDGTITIRVKDGKYTSSHSRW